MWRLGCRTGSRQDASERQRRGAVWLKRCGTMVIYQSATKLIRSTEQNNHQSLYRTRKQTRQQGKNKELNHCGDSATCEFNFNLSGLSQSAPAHGPNTKQCTPPVFAHAWQRLVKTSASAAVSSTPFWPKSLPLCHSIGHRHSDKR